MDSILNFFEQRSFYVVLLITLIIWAGFFFYMIRLDNKVKKLEKDLPNK